MNDIVDAVLQSFGQNVEEAAVGKARNYAELLASAGKSEEQLVARGLASLDELLHPDPRYSGG
jgi:hypothetical protein